MAETPPDRIYLQSGRPGPVWRLPTWQEVAMHNDDLEYLRATPERLAAGEMEAALTNLVGLCEPGDGSIEHRRYEPPEMKEARAALANARGEG